MASKYSRRSALLLPVLLFVSLFSFSALADEGMFLPDTLNQLPLKKLNQRGLKIPITDLYNPSGPSIKDAVVTVAFGPGYGTGEFVSAEGLVLTNHHVAFDALVSASDPAKDYATNGYTAHNRSDELPAKGYTISITQDLKDVTADVLKGVVDTMSPPERNVAIQRNSAAVRNGNTKPADGVTATVLPINEGQAYYLFTTFTLNDVRIVYAPPKNIGFFGGDPDNFEWPRHDGDFTFLRAYVGADGKPAAYSTSNVPFKPKKFMTLSMGGVKENEFVMVMGYPGSTRRYRESYSVAYNQDVFMPFLIDAFNKQIEVLQNLGKNNRELQIKLQSRIFEISNTLKDFEGSVVAMRRAGIVDQKRGDEATFTRWLNETPERKAKYGDVLPSLQKAYAELLKSQPRDLLVQQLGSLSDLFEIAPLIPIAAADKEKPEAQHNPNIALAVQRARAALPQIFADRSIATERELLAFYLRKAAELPAGQKIEAVEKRFGNLTGEARVRAEEDFTRAAIESKNFASAQAVSALFDMSAAQIEMHGTKPYPDANRTLRFTYGEVKGYVPHDAAVYQPFTNLSGVIEKDTGREPFDVPEKLKQLYRTHDFGPYATSDGRNVPVDCLSTTDIIGGNSGSPIMNGRGEQVGIIFDGNYEGLGNDFFYNDTKGRAIAVDIRYVLFVTDKFGGAGYIFKEMDIKNASAGLRRAA